MICTSHPKLFGLRKIKNNGRGGACDTSRIQERGYRVLVRGESRERGHLEEPNIHWNDNI